MKESNEIIFDLPDFLGGIHQEIHNEALQPNQVPDWMNVVLHQGMASSDRAWVATLPELPSGFTPVAYVSFPYAGVNNAITLCFGNYDDAGTLRGRIHFYYPLFRTGASSGDTSTTGDAWGTVTDTTDLPPFYNNQVQFGYFPRMNYTDIAGTAAGRTETSVNTIARLLFCVQYDGRLFEVVIDTSGYPHTITSDLYINRSGFNIWGFNYYKDRLFLWGEANRYNVLSWSDPNAIRVDTSGGTGSTKDFNGGLENYAANDGGYIVRDAIHNILFFGIWQNKAIVFGDNAIEVGDYIGHQDYLIRYRAISEHQLYAYNFYNSYELKPTIFPSLVAETPYGIAFMTNAGVFVFTGDPILQQIPNGYTDLFEPTLPTVEGNFRVGFKQMFYHQGLNELWALYYKITASSLEVPPLPTMTQSLAQYLTAFNTLQDGRKTTFDGEQSTRKSSRSTDLTNNQAGLTAAGSSISTLDTGIRDTLDGVNAPMFEALKNEDQTTYLSLGQKSFGWALVSPNFYLYLETLRATFPQIQTAYDSNTTFKATYDDFVSNQRYDDYYASRDMYVAYLAWLDSGWDDSLDLLDNVAAYIASLASNDLEDVTNKSYWDEYIQGWYTQDTVPDPDTWSSTAAVGSYGRDFADDMEDYREEFEFTQEQRELRLNNLGVSGPREFEPVEDFSNIDSTEILRYNFTTKTWYKNRLPLTNDFCTSIAKIFPDFLGTVRSVEGAISPIVYPEIIGSTKEGDIYLYSDFDSTYAQECFLQTKMLAVPGKKFTTERLQVVSDTNEFWIYYRYKETDDWTFLCKANDTMSYGLVGDTRSIQFGFGYLRSEDPVSSACRFQIKAVRLIGQVGSTW